jgi:hypothetical protein
VLITVIGIAAYLPYAFTARYIVDVSRVLATLYLVSFGVLGGLAAYRLERSHDRCSSASASSTWNGSDRTDCC